LPQQPGGTLAVDARLAMTLGPCSAGSEELQFVLVLRDYDHLLTAAAPETVIRTNMSQSLVGHRMAFGIRLRNGSHTAKLVSFADGKMLAMSVLAINLGADEDMNQKVQPFTPSHSLLSRLASSGVLQSVFFFVSVKNIKVNILENAQRSVLLVLYTTLCRFTAMAANDRRIQPAS
jgi:hypothetical protein